MYQTQSYSYSCEPNNALYTCSCTPPPLHINNAPLAAPPPPFLSYKLLEPNRCDEYN